ncbi:uncharacterized protein LOC118406544 [Branchiostoma floridae]|uniref:Uncharacterized protein LOC118406544 n=1 Tax=Branchiostoma floridae TaxID=7739 RepID=A0A9J7KGX1_BRAFL|nr:uncharacterized protein LOC118406544 [Branchiostoma floridae]
MDHKGNLLKVCRTCGVRFKMKKGNPKPVTAFREVILHLFNGSDVCRDQEDIHPPFVCEKCRGVLSKAQGKMKAGQAAVTMLSDKLPDFQPHLEDNCIICNYKPTGRPVKKKPWSLKESSPVEVATLTAPACTSEEDAPLPTPACTSEEDAPLPTPACTSEEDAPLPNPACISEEDAPLPTPACTSEKDAPLPTPACTSEEDAPLPTPACTSRDEAPLDVLTDKEITEEAVKHGFVYLGTVNNGDLAVGKCDVNSLHFDIQQQINIKQDRTWEMLVYKKRIPQSHPALSSLDLPSVVTMHTMSKLFLELTHCYICIGNVGYEELLEEKRDGMEIVVFKGNNGTVVAKEEKGLIKDGGRPYHHTIRHVNCQLVIPSNKLTNKCETCTKYSSSLRGMLHRVRHKGNTDLSHSSRVPNKHLTKEQLRAKTADVQREKTLQKTIASKAKECVEKAVEKEGCHVKESQHAFLQTMLKTGNDKMQFQDNSPQQFLYEQQLKQAQQHDARTMRWHPMMIRWCLSIFYQSPAAYDTIRNSGFLYLPHRTTLQQYSKFTNPTPGFNPDILKRLGEESNVVNEVEYKKNVCLIWDEMKIKSGLVYSKTSGELVGFTDLGGVNNELKAFEKRCQAEQHGTEEEPDLATHVLAFMVRGIFINLQFVFAYFPCLGFSSDQLYPAVWQANAILDQMGFHVRAFVSDGASPNRRFYKVHEDDQRLVYWTWNPYRPGEKMYFMSDVPHLMKTTRNNMENSGWHSKTRNLHYNGQEISWKHIVSVYEWDLGLQRQAVGLRMLHKLKADHVYLNPALRMRVNLAVQVLSNSMSCALAMQGRHDTVSTRNFISMMNRFFDCLNVQNQYQGQRGNMPDLEPYRDVDDIRFTWLEKDFLGFLHHWEQQAAGTPGLSKDQRNRMCLSKQTLEGLRITVSSFVELTKTLIQEEGVGYVLSEKFTQDPLEQHFAKQRRRCGANENPTALEFGRNEINLHILKDSIRSVGGNCRGRAANAQAIDFTDNTPLPKRQRKK